MDAICHAIRHHTLLEFLYEGRPRIVAPYCHGVSSRGVEVVRGIQVGGATTSGFGFGKLFAVKKIEQLQLSAQTFIPDDPDYNPGDRAMREIHCCVELRRAL